MCDEGFDSGGDVGDVNSDVSNTSSDVRNTRDDTGVNYGEDLARMMVPI